MITLHGSNLSRCPPQTSSFNSVKVKEQLEPLSILATDLSIHDTYDFHHSACLPSLRFLCIGTLSNSLPFLQVLSNREDIRIY